MAKEMNYEALNANLKMLDKKGEMNLELLRRQDTAAAEKLEKIGELLRNEQFAEAFLAVDSAEDAVKLFAGRGVELSEEEVTALAKQAATAAKKLIENGGELSEEELELIAGGWSGDNAATGAGIGLLVGGVAGTLVCPGVGSLAGIACGAAVGTVIGGVAQEIGAAAKKVGGFFSNVFSKIF